MITNAEREYLIERYTSGAMSPSEEHELFARAGQDPELQRHLQAEQLIGSAVRRERSAMPGPSAGSRAQFLTMLAAVSSEIPPAAAPTGGDPSPLRYLPGTRRTQGIVAAIAGTALIVGAIVMAPRSESPRAIERQAPAVTAPVTPPMAPPQAPVASPVQEAPAAKSADSKPTEAAPAKPAASNRTSVARAKETRPTAQRNADRVRTTKSAVKPEPPTLNDSKAKGTIPQRKPREIE